MAFFLGYSMLFFKGGVLSSLYPFSAALVLAGFDLSGYAGMTAASGSGAGRRRGWRYGPLDRAAAFAVP